MSKPDIVPIIEVFFSEGVEARLESLTVSTVLRSSNGMSPEVYDQFEFYWNLEKNEKY